MDPLAGWPPPESELVAFDDQLTSRLRCCTCCGCVGWVQIGLFPLWPPGPGSLSVVCFTLCARCMAQYAASVEHLQQLLAARYRIDAHLCMEETLR